MQKPAKGVPTMAGIVLRISTVLLHSTTLLVVGNTTNTLSGADAGMLFPRLTRNGSDMRVWYMCAGVCVCMPYQSLLATKGLPLSSSSTDAEPILPSPSAEAAAAEADKSDVGFDE